MRLRSLAPLALVLGGCHLVGGPSYFVESTPLETGAGGGAGGAASTNVTGTTSTTSASTADSSSSGGGAPVSSCELAPCEKGDLRCKKPVCLSADECGYESLESGTTCNELLGLRCDGKGSCVECLIDQDCEDAKLPFCSELGLCVECVSDEPCKNKSDALVCGGFACVTAPCNNQVKDQGETDVDCGGPCNPCGPGKGCAKFSDCVSGVCDQGLCGCNDSAQCEPGFYCELGEKACKPQKGGGSGCKAPDECLSGKCSKGLSCWFEPCCG